MKSKIAERSSKREVLKSYGTNQGSKTPSADSVFVTQASIDKLTKDIKDLRKKVKKDIQQKNEYFSSKVTTQKTIDL